MMFSYSEEKSADTCTIIVLISADVYSLLGFSLVSLPLIEK